MTNNLQVAGISLPQGETSKEDRNDLQTLLQTHLCSRKATFKLLPGLLPLCSLHRQSSACSKCPSVVYGATSALMGAACSAAETNPPEAKPKCAHTPAANSPPTALLPQSCSP